MIPAQQGMVTSKIVLFSILQGYQVPTTFTTGTVFLINFDSFPPRVFFIAEV